MKTIGVILSGCGYQDGAEIREAVLSLLYLDQYLPDAQVRILAPNIDQLHVINHLNGTETPEKRNLLQEAARIARGKIEDISKVNPSDFDGMVIPGGYGVAKNLSTFAFKGAEGEVLPVIKNFLVHVHENKKPMVGICIAPAMLALILGEKAPLLTIGSDEATAEEIKKTGARHERTSPSQSIVDTKLKIVTTPAYMYDDAPLREIAKGIEEAIKNFSQMI
jgi:enhancing lycopene biosynthesis protein 2